MVKKLKLDSEEQELLDSYERGEWKSAPSSKQEIQIAQRAASQFMKKDARINIRMSSHDLDGLKQIAVREGLSYQTLIGSILHKFVSGNQLAGN
ncbi:MAG: hypothetical protein JKY15_02315 [Deltaproteobacteria bacterium]|nr:hypothetical protein [Deltaproteobacteria bacterium]